MAKQKDPLEKLFMVGSNYLHVQYLADDPEYDFDYTIYDESFHNIDGGVIGVMTGWDLLMAANEIVADAQKYGIIAKEQRPVEVDIEKYLDAL